MFGMISRLAGWFGLVFLVLSTSILQGQSTSRSKDLKIVAIDVDGGAATLFVTPEGKSLLIDAGWPPGMGGGRRPQAGADTGPPPTSSADRIAAAAASLGITKLDYLVMTHYHIDHLGGVESLVKKLPVDTFVDHGPNREEVPPNPTPREIAISPATIYPAWPAAFAGHKHLSLKTGETLKIGSLELKVVASDGVLLPSPLPGAGQPNPFCAGIPPHEPTGGEENVRSLGLLMTFGKTLILDLGDLTYNKDVELLCPANKIGKVDVYFIPNHGMDLSNSPATAGLDPLVAIMQNGRTKGSDESVLKTIHTYPDLEGLWRGHISVKTADMNGDPNYIANLDELPDKAYPIDIDISPAGKIIVTNERNQFSQTYTARAAQAKAKN